MRKVALVFLLAVILPSLVLAWLAIRSLRDQQFLVERQQSLLCQDVADDVARKIQDALAADQAAFTAKVSELLSRYSAQSLSRDFDAVLRSEWPLAQIGFVVSPSDQLLSPDPTSGPEARSFNRENGQFLGSREVAEVYLNSKAAINNAIANAASPSQSQLQYELADKDLNSSRKPGSDSYQSSPVAANPAGAAQSDIAGYNRQQKFGGKVQSRSVIPQQKLNAAQVPALKEETQQQEFSKVAPSEAEFRQLIGDSTEGTLARFIDNKLNVLVWTRAPGNPKLIFGAKLRLRRLVQDLAPLVQASDSSLRGEICTALLDDTAKPVAISVPGFTAQWKRPFVATEIGEALPHWELAVYLLDPARLANSARALKLTLGLLISILIVAIGIGSWLIVADLNRQLRLARQKTDFVSNVSHELKTPLTSIRMFSELLAQGRVDDPAKQKSYLGIITAETARLTRLINNVLDFARIERGEKKYKFEKFDLRDLVKETCETFRPHLEANGFTFVCQLSDGTNGTDGTKSGPANTEPVFVNGDRDALAQVIVNLLSNAEKYSGEKKEIEIRLEGGAHGSDAPCLERVRVMVLDRGFGVPKGCEEKIFEQFYRAHDSLSSGIQGSGLGLTLARQIARAHGGEVTYAGREDGGSCFTLTVPATT